MQILNEQTNGDAAVASISECTVCSRTDGETPDAASLYLQRSCTATVEQTMLELAIADLYCLATDYLAHHISTLVLPSIYESSNSRKG